MPKVPDEQESGVGRELSRIWRDLRRSRFGGYLVAAVVVFQGISVWGDVEFAITKAIQLGPPLVSGTLALMSAQWFQAVATGVGLAWLWDSNRQRTKGLELRLARSEAERARLEGERAELDVRFGDEPPYTLPTTGWYRIGIFNKGPAKASEVEVRLVSVSPRPNPLPEPLLPVRVGWKGGGVLKEIHAGRERLLDIVHYSMRNRDGSPTFFLQFWLDEGGAQFAPDGDFVYELQLEILSANADPKDVKLELWRVGDTARLRIVPPDEVTKA